MNRLGNYLGMDITGVRLDVTDVKIDEYAAGAPGTVRKTYITVKNTGKNDIVLLPDAFKVWTWVYPFADKGVAQRRTRLNSQLRLMTTSAGDLFKVGESIIIEQTFTDMEKHTIYGVEGRPVYYDIATKKETNIGPYFGVFEVKVNPLADMIVPETAVAAPAAAAESAPPADFPVGKPAISEVTKKAFIKKIGLVLGLGIGGAFVLWLFNRKKV